MKGFRSGRRGESEQCTQQVMISRDARPPSKGRLTHAPFVPVTSGVAVTSLEHVTCPHLARGDVPECTAREWGVGEGWREGGGG